MPDGAPWQPQDDPPCVWRASWSVLFEFVELAVESTVFDCVTLPSLPGLRTRTGMFVFEAPYWLAVESAPAVWAFPAHWSAVWMPPEPPWFWLALWSVSFEFDAVASEVAELVWVTDPL